MKRKFRLAIAPPAARTRERAPYFWAQTQGNFALAYLAPYKKSGEPRRLDEALKDIDGALAEFREAGAVYDFERAERQRAEILAANGARPRLPPSLR